jgi:hypothetical protein
MTVLLDSYFSPKLDVRAAPAKGGFGVFASDSCPFDEFECACGSPQCRGWVIGSDWKRPELWERYAGCFSPYLQRRIALLKHGLPDEAGEVLFELAEPPRLKREHP